MPRRAYIQKTFGADALATIRQADQICSDYASQGYDLTLRQLYYQFVSRDLIPNKDSEYKKLGKTISDARLAGYLDWDYIVDRTRNLRSLATWDDPADRINFSARAYRTDKWKDQPEHVEVWIEKDALVGILEAACDPLQVDYFSCRGYTSQSEVWGAAQRLRDYITDGKRVTIIHLGDHDPSGIDMTRDIDERLSVFIGVDLINEDGWSQADALAAIEHNFEVDRIALNMDQIEEYGPPPNPAKLTDTRSRKYVEAYGPDSWELDALDPNTLVNLIQDAIREHRNDDLWIDASHKEEQERQLLFDVSARWDEVEALIEEAS